MTLASPATRGRVSLVVPGRDAARTLERCLASAAALLGHDGLAEIVFVDDGSRDDSVEIARAQGARCLDSGGRGPGAARNVGWRAAGGGLVWFIDADCVVFPETLGRLLEELDDAAVAGVGGSYSNAVPGSRLARLIHAEIRQRHVAMRGDADYLGSFNVVYRRAVLEEVGGFDEAWVNAPGAPGGEDADLSYRVTARGHRLRFRADARVAHHHPVGLGGYLRAQRVHGFWGVRLYRRHPGRGRANSYSGHLDHLQPLLAVASVLALPLALLPRLAWLAAVPPALLLASTLPRTFGLVRERGAEMVLFAPLATLRAFARGAGLVQGLLDWVTPGEWRPRR